MCFLSENKEHWLVASGEFGIISSTPSRAVALWLLVVSFWCCRVLFSVHLQYIASLYHRQPHTSAFEHALLNWWLFIYLSVISLRVLSQAAACWGLRAAIDTRSRLMWSCPLGNALSQVETRGLSGSPLFSDSSTPCLIMDVVLLI